MTDRCELRHVLGEEVACDEEECIFWRVVDHVYPMPKGEGCAIQYFELLGDGGSELAVWLLSVKERIEAQEGSWGSAVGLSGPSEGQDGEEGLSA